MTTMIKLLVHLTDDVEQAIKQFVLATGISKSELVRRAIREYIDKRKEA